MAKKSKRTKPERVYVTQTHVQSFDESEIDFDLDNEFGLDKDSDDNYQYLSIIEKGEGKHEGYKDYVDNTPIHIDRMIKILAELKEKGCNYVALDYHCDHIAYEVSGFIMRHSTPEEIEEEENKDNKKKAAKDKVDKLVAEARKIAKEAGL
jgi:hypothetical protein